MFLNLFLVRSYCLEVWKKWLAPLDAQGLQHASLLPFLCYIYKKDIKEPL